jgi:hypothetical protein
MRILIFLLLINNFFVGHGLDVVKNDVKKRILCDGIFDGNRTHYIAVSPADFRIKLLEIIKVTNKNKKEDYIAIIYAEKTNKKYTIKNKMKLGEWYVASITKDSVMLRAEKNRESFGSFGKVIYILIMELDHSNKE